MLITFYYSPEVFKTMMSLFTSKKKESEKMQKCDIPEMAELKLDDDVKKKVDENQNFGEPLEFKMHSF